MKTKIDWGRSWYRLPFLPFRLFFIGGAYYVLEPLAKLFETIGSKFPGLEQK